MAETARNAGVVSFSEARRIVEEQARAARAPEAELTSLLAAVGRVLAENVAADRDFPPFPRATRDGYAVRAVETQGASTRDDTRAFRVVGQVKAGEAFDAPVSAGEAVEIMTGAPVPAGTDAVVMVEYTRPAGDEVIVERAVEAGENVVPAGAEARAGAVLLRTGTRLTPAAIAVAGACGRHELKVFRRPRVAILSTGDELVDVAAAPGPNQIRNSNSYSLAAQVRQAGGEAVVLPVAPDEPGLLRKLMQEGLASDLLLLSGGVSMGKYDLVEQVLGEMGAEFFFTGALIQPGRPVVFGRAANTYFFGLPGNPVSTMVCFELFARAMVEALAGAAPRRLVFVEARLKSEVRVKPGLTRFLPAVLGGEHERAEVEAVKWQGSGDMAANARANCYLVAPPESEIMKAGEPVSVLVPGLL
jgi:molybdopterin molybdotransferase